MEYNLIFISLCKIYRWWLDWCQHMGVTEDRTIAVADSALLALKNGCGSSPSFRLVLTIKEGILSSKNGGISGRPDEIDNSSLQDVHNLNAFSDSVLHQSASSPSSPLENLVFLTAAAWFALVGIYGGGPEFFRRVRSVEGQLAPANTLSQGGRIDVDLQPMILQGYWCAASGHPSPFHQKALVSSDGSSRDLIKWALIDLDLFTDETRTKAEESQVGLTVDDVNVWVLRPTNDQRRLSPHTKNTRECHLLDDSSNAQIDVRVATESSVHSKAPKISAGERAAVPKEGLQVLRHGPETYWQLLEGTLRESALSKINVGSGSIVMFESCCIPSASSADHPISRGRRMWPTCRVLEPSNFRIFKMWQWVDVLSHHGKWKVAQIIRIFSSSEEKLDFQKFPSRDKSMMKSSDSLGDPRGTRDTVRVLLYF